MREYVLNVAYRSQAFGRFAWVSRALSNWRMRKSIRQMLRLDPYILRDIGLTPADLEKLLSMSDRVDLKREAERMAFLNARGTR